MRTWKEIKMEMMELKTLDDIMSERETYVRPRIKGRIFKANNRANARWYRNPVNLCVCGNAQRYVFASTGFCPYGYCTQEYCPDCTRIWGGVGPAGCLCDSRSGGHQRRAEQPKPSVRRKYRDRRPRALHYWERSENVN